MKNELTLYAPFIKEIKDLIYRRQYEAMKTVNTELIQLYWEIGREIERKQREQGWGKSVVEVLAKELQKEFPGVQGLSARNLWLMRSFYAEYSQNAILYPMGAELEDASKATNLKPMVAELDVPQRTVSLLPLIAEIGWSKNIVIMQKCKNPQEREFYIKMTKRYGWTKDVLINNIENKAFEKYLTNQTNFDEAVPEKYRLQAKLSVKDAYIPYAATNWSFCISAFRRNAPLGRKRHPHTVSHPVRDAPLGKSGPVTERAFLRNAGCMDGPVSTERGIGYMPDRFRTQFPAGTLDKQKNRREAPFVDTRKHKA